MFDILIIFLSDVIVVSQNDLFETLDDNILDFSESNPFGDAGSAE